ncbi:hypothetical protein [Achromobacter sp. AGC25]
MLVKAVAVLGLTLLAGCMSTPVSIDTAPRVEASSIINPEVLEANPEKGLVRIVRDAAIFGPGMYVLLYLDGRHVANIQANRVVELNVPAGARRVGFQVNDVSQPIRYEDLSVVAGQTYDFRISVTAGGMLGNWKFERLN